MAKSTAPIIQFGTDGWRALVAEEFTLPNVRVVAQGVASYLRSHRVAGRSLKVIVGYDTRPFGDRFAEAVAEVFAGNGFRVLLTKGPMPTPAVSFSIREFRLAGGVVVTASHNPFTYNGLKFKPSYAGPAEPAMTRWIEGRLFREAVKRLSLSEGIAQGKIQSIDLTPRYLNFLKRYIRWPILRKARFRVAYDSMHGAGQNLLQRFLAGTPLQILTMRQACLPPACRLPAGQAGTGRDRQAGEQIKSSHRPEPIGEHLIELASLVRRERCDIGLATDGDADRLGVVGPDGRFISSQETMALLIWHLLEDRGWRGMVATTISATNLMEAITGHYGVPLRRTPVGFKHIARLMRTKDVLFGGEESGGFGFRGCVPERDGLLAGLLMMEMMAMRKKSLGTILKELRGRFGHWFFHRADVTLPRPLSSEKLSAWAKVVSRDRLKRAVGMAVHRILTEDGVKVIFEDHRWVLLRLSGTEPVLRIYAEAKSETDVRALLKTGQQIGQQLL